MLKKLFLCFIALLAPFVSLCVIASNAQSAKEQKPFSVTLTGTTNEKIGRIEIPTEISFIKNWVPITWFLIKESPNYVILFMSMPGNEDDEIDGIAIVKSKSIIQSGTTITFTQNMIEELYFLDRGSGRYSKIYGDGKHEHWIKKIVCPNCMEV